MSWANGPHSARLRMGGPAGSTPRVWLQPGSGTTGMTIGATRSKPESAVSAGMLSGTAQTNHICRMLGPTTAEKEPLPPVPLLLGD